MIIFLFWKNIFPFSYIASLGYDKLAKGIVKFGAIFPSLNIGTSSGVLGGGVA